MRWSPCKGMQTEYAFDGLFELGWARDRPEENKDIAHHLTTSSQGLQMRAPGKSIGNGWPRPHGSARHWPKAAGAWQASEENGGDDPGLLEYATNRCPFPHRDNGFDPAMSALWLRDRLYDLAAFEETLWRLGDYNAAIMPPAREAEVGRFDGDHDSLRILATTELRSSPQSGHSPDILLLKDSNKRKEVGKKQVDSLDFQDQPDNKTTK